MADDSVEKAILALQTTWVEAEQAGRIDDLCALMCGDIVLQPPIGEQVAGLTAVRAFLHQPGPPIRRIVLSGVAIESDGALAVKRARFRAEFEGARAVSGRHLWVLRAPWRVVFVTWSFDAPP